MKYYLFGVPHWIIQGKVILSIAIQLCCHWSSGVKIVFDCDNLQCDRFTYILLSWLTLMVLNILSVSHFSNLGKSYNIT